MMLATSNDDEEISEDRKHRRHHHRRATTVAPTTCDICGQIFPRCVVCDASGAQLIARVTSVASSEKKSAADISSAAPPPPDQPKVPVSDSPWDLECSNRKCAVQEEDENGKQEQKRFCCDNCKKYYKCPEPKCAVVTRIEQCEGCKILYGTRCEAHNHRCSSSSSSSSLQQQQQLLCTGCVRR